MVCGLQAVQYVGRLMCDDLAKGIVIRPARATDVCVLAGGRAFPAEFDVSDIYAVISERLKQDLVRGAVEAGGEVGFDTRLAPGRSSTNVRPANSCSATCVPLAARRAP